MRLPEEDLFEASDLWRVVRASSCLLLLSSLELSDTTIYQP